MKYRLGKKYYLIAQGEPHEILFHSFHKALDGAGVYSKEVYYDKTGTEILTVENRDIQIISRPIFRSKNSALDFQIRKLKSCKEKSISAKEPISNLTGGTL